MDAMLKESVAALFCHVIKKDDKDIEKERPIFCRFMKQDFDCDCEEANQLLDETMDKEYNIDTQISIIGNALCNKTYDKVSLMKQLNHIIIKDKLNSEDYEVFDKLKKALALC
ncbi:MAG TPA: hypothetical protein ENK86_01800 [Campylobacterales bacterium]|nr:hypothetical protein [Campylobacterales bacterium]